MIDAIIDGYNFFNDFLNSGIYTFFTEFLAVLIEYYLISVIKTKIFFVTVGWSIAKNLIANIGLSAAINSAWGGIDQTLLSYLTFFRLPEAINILLQASTTRFILALF